MTERDNNNNLFSHEGVLYLEVPYTNRRQVSPPS